MSAVEIISEIEKLPQAQRRKSTFGLWTRNSVKKKIARTMRRRIVRWGNPRAIPWADARKRMGWA